jgi:hypothetical protein
MGKIPYGAAIFTLIDTGKTQLGILERIGLSTSQPLVCVHDFYVIQKSLV